MNEIIKGPLCELDDNIWQDLILPLSINDTLVNRIAREYSKNNRNKSKIESLNYTIEYAKQYYIEKAKHFISLPLNVYICEYEGNHMYNQFSIIDDLDEIKRGQSVPYDRLIRDVDRFKRIYDLFRPDKIEQDHYYWGTVKLMDAIYDTFSSVFKINYNHKFSKYGHSWIDDLYKQEYKPEDVNWTGLIDDVIAIKKPYMVQFLN